MGSIIGGVLGGVGSIAGAVIQSNAADKAAKQALTGYNYLTKGAGAPLITGAVQNATKAQDAYAQLIGLKPMGEGTNDAFSNYLNSTGYQFQMGQGQNAIASSAAAKGLLNSGATAKALTRFGQDLGTTSFGNYLNLLGGVNTMGQNAATTVANAGTGAGSAAAPYVAAGGNAIANGVTGALGSFGGAASNFLTQGSLQRMNTGGLG